MASYATNDGSTQVNVNGPLDPSAPLVVLLHGVGGDEMHMTDPPNGAQLGGVMFDKSAGFTLLRDAGWHLTPPTIPVDGFEIDPSLTSVTSWSQALNAAGFPTLSYTQIQPNGELGPNLAQLILIAGDILSNPAHPELAGMRLAFLAHSRGGVLLRQFLLGAAVNSAFMSRVVAAITLHSPHSGSGIANAAVTVDQLAGSVQSVFAGAGITPPGFLALIRSQASSPAYPEIAVNSLLLAALAAAEPSGPVPGVEWHTFGGTSTQFARLRAFTFTPDSGIPIFFPLVPFPFFHWTTLALQVGVPVDAFSFLPIPVPVVGELQATVTVLAASTPELTQGSGDLLTTDTRAHLPFSLSHTSNPINHAEALYDPTLQAQVLAILARFRILPPPPPPPPQVTVPDVVGENAVDAGTALRAAGFSVDQRSFVDHSCNSIGDVASQSPIGGAILAAGSTVTIQVGERPDHPCP